MSGKAYLPTNSFASDNRNLFNNSDRRKRRDDFREIGAAYRAICRVAGFLPIEIRTAEAITLCHYEVAGQDYDKPRAIKLALIGTVLSSHGESEKSKVNTASNRTSHFFTNAQPRTGYQILTRYKAVEENRPHEYVDHITPVAEVVAEYWATERRVILSDSQPQKQARIADALERLATEALELLPKCEAQLVDENGEVYAYLSDAEARTYSAKNPNFQAQAKTTRPKRPLCAQDFDRIEEKFRNWIADELEDAKARNSPDEARLWAVRLETKVPKWIRSWVKADGAPDGREKEERERELIHVPEFGGQGVTEPPSAEQVAPQMLGGNASLSGLETNDLKNGCVDASTEPAPLVLVGLRHFDGVLEAADFYIRDGVFVLPLCNWNPATGRCTAEWHKPTCGGKKPLVAGDGEAGYSMATRDIEQVKEWLSDFPDMGLGRRLDNQIAFDCDVKDNAGGLVTYQEYADTFSLPETLTQVTPSAGAHFVFDLPEGLPQGYLKSWVRILPGMDLKVHVGGQIAVEPTCGRLGFYRWVDATFPPATLPREACDYLHNINELKTRPKTERAKAARITSLPQRFDSDQSKYFRDVPNGERHRRLFEVGCSIRANTRAGAAEIAEAMRYHAAHFSDPVNDEKYIRDTSARIERCY